MPDDNCRKKTCFGIRLSSMRITWPTQRNCVASNTASMPLIPQRRSTSVFGTLSCHLIPAILFLLHHTHTHTHTHGQTQNDFIICPMLYAIAMGQIIIPMHVMNRDIIPGMNKTARRCPLLSVTVADTLISSLKVVSRAGVG